MRSQQKRGSVSTHQASQKRSQKQDSPSQHPRTQNPTRGRRRGTVHSNAEKHEKAATPSSTTRRLTTTPTISLVEHQRRRGALKRRVCRCGPAPEPPACPPTSGAGPPGTRRIRLPISSISSSGGGGDVRASTGTKPGGDFRLESGRMAILLQADRGIAPSSSASREQHQRQRTGTTPRGRAERVSQTRELAACSYLARG